MNDAAFEGIEQLAAADATSGAGPGRESRWELFAHEADIGARGRGPTPAAAFAGAALAMTAAIVDPSTVRQREAVNVSCAAPDLELLLVDWLNALIFEMATRGMLFAAFAVEIADGRLEATVEGEQIDPARHAPAVEVKGATYTALQVSCAADGTWTAQCVIDV